MDKYELYIKLFLFILIFDYFIGIEVRLTNFFLYMALGVATFFLADLAKLLLFLIFGKRKG